MTVRFARHGSKPQTDPTPSPCEEEWIRLQPVAFEVGGLCYNRVRWHLVGDGHSLPSTLSAQDSKADTARQLLFSQEDDELSSFTASCRWD